MTGCDFKLFQVGASILLDFFRDGIFMKYFMKYFHNVKDQYRIEL